MKSQPAVAGLVLLVGFAGALLLASARQRPSRAGQPAVGPLVEVVRAARADVAVVVRGHGEVAPKVVVDLVPEVSGRVTGTSSALVAGGFFTAGEELVTIDRRDYELAVERAAAAVEKAKVALASERAEAAVATQEWEAMHPGMAPASELVVRAPQLRQAEAELVASEADLEAARLDLERTTISLPFDGVVVSKSIDVGQVVAPGAAVARVYGTASAEVRVPLEDRELAFFDLPSAGQVRGPRALVSVTFAGASQVWEGSVRRLEAEVDESARMVHVVVEVERPYERRGQRPPLLPGTFVEVEISGRSLHGVVPLPRHALREGRTVWVVEGDRLRVREVEIARAERETVYLAAGVEAGESVVVSALDAVTDGMVVRTPAAGERSSPAGGGA